MLFFIESQEKISDSTKLRLILDVGFSSEFVEILEDKNLKPIFDYDDFYANFKVLLKDNSFERIDFDKTYDYLTSIYDFNFSFYVLQESVVSAFQKVRHNEFVFDEEFSIWLKRINLFLKAQPMNINKIFYINYEEKYILYIDHWSIRGNEYNDYDAYVLSLHEAAGLR
jgi:hypothetical protein